MDRGQTLQEVIRARGKEHDLGILFINAENDEIFVSYAQLYERALQILHYLQSAGVKKGNELVLQIDDNPTFINVFWACILGGIIPVPLAVGSNEEHLTKLKNVVALLNFPYLITGKAFAAKLETLFEPSENPLIHEILTKRTICWDEMQVSVPGEIRTGTPEDIAFIQFSSGSTGNPKGVILKHRNLLANIEGIVSGFGLTPEDSFLSWVPLTHDLGMIGFHITPLTFGINHAIIATAAFIRRPLLWFDKISVHKFNITSSPNFGYRFLLNALKSSERDWNLSHVRMILNGAEPISAELCDQFLTVMATYGLRRTAMFLGYGLAEATLVVVLPSLNREFREVYLDRHYLKTGESVHYCSKEDRNRVSFVIEGSPILNVRLRIVGAQGEVLPGDAIGRIEIKGENVTCGYYNNPIETANTINEEGWLDTGDLGFLVGGELVITGRAKDIIFAQGQNFYPYDLERIAEQVDGVELGKVAVTSYFDHQSGEDRILLFVLYKKNDLEKFIATANRLKQVIITQTGLKVSQVIPIKKIPKTTSGKIQRYKLSEQFQQGQFDAILAETEAVRRSQKSAAQLEQAAWQRENLKQKVVTALLEITGEAIGYPITDCNAGFADLGIQSVNLPQFQRLLESNFGMELPVSIIYDYPTLNQLADFIVGKTAGEPDCAGVAGGSVPRRAVDTNFPVAVIGIGCRFPGGANHPEAFWRNLINGVDAVGGFPEERRKGIDDDPPGAASGKMATQSGGFLADIDRFDPLFFGITPKEAAFIDPQQRLLLEVCWEAFEDAGMGPDSIPKSTGVFIGISNNDYLENTTHSLENLEGYAYTGAMLSGAAGRIAYTFGLQGPAISLDTACSSSLVAVHQAVKGLHYRECEMAIAGGVNLIISPKAFIGFSQLNALAPDGRCKTFDDAADGYGRSEGCGVVVLKPLEKAIRDRNRIYGVITGSAVNHDGQSAGFTVPNGPAQEQVIRRALEVAGIRPEMVDYLEAHGSGTKIGDSQEVNALARVFAKRTPEHKLWIGTVKTNIGHCESSAGMAGLIKTVLALTARRIPKNLHYRTPNQQIDWQTVPLQVVAATSDWPQKEQPRIAGVSSFGITGTNAHLVVQEAPAVGGERTTPDREYHLLTFAAKSEAALRALMEEYRRYLEETTEPVSDICYTSNLSRGGFRYRCAVSGGTNPELGRKIRLVLEKGVEGTTAVLPERTGDNPGIAFVFTGQGSVYEQVALELYQKEPVFQAALSRCDRLFTEQLNCPVIAMLYSGLTPDDADPGLEASVYAQAGIFSIEYALGELWLSWGIKPSLVFGHSIGEYAAACFAGVFSLEDAVKLVAIRIKVMESVAFKGKMAGVLTHEAKVREIIGDYPEISLAAINAAENITVSGPAETLEQALIGFKNERIFIERLHISHPFHSKLMEPYAEKFRDRMAGVSFQKPSIPIIATIAGPFQMDTADYWCNHLHRPVGFYEAVQKVDQLGYRIFVEIGGTATLSGLVSQTISGEAARFIPSLRRGKNAEEHMLAGLAQLYLNGVSIDWEQFHRPFDRRRVTLPNYPFQRQPYWIAKRDPEIPGANREMHRPVISKDGDEPETMKNQAQLTQKAESPAPIIATVKTIIDGITGLRENDIDNDTNLISLGLDSLMLVQLRKKINQQYHLDISLNQFFVELNTIHAIAGYIHDQTRNAGLFEPDNLLAAQEQPTQTKKLSAGQTPLDALLQQQLEIIRHDHQLFSRQLELMQGLVQTGAAGQFAMELTAPSSVLPKPEQVQREPVNLRSMKFEKEDLTEAQMAFITQFILKYNRKTKSSKEYAAANRRVFSDWINSLNFRMDLKELNYPIVSARSAGSRFWDRDGNEYIDIALGYGVNFFGHKPVFVVEALQRQLTEGFELGPQSDLAGRVAAGISRLTGVERVSFCNTGSEAVMVALRIARTVTKRTKIVLFAASFHGNYDGILAQTDAYGTFPVSPGTTEGAVTDVIVLEYGTAATLEKIKAFGNELAAVLVEPVQSRRPDFQPVAFLKELRRITAATGTVLIFDEVVNGFRIHPGGAQAHFGIKADIVTYGKIIGGGLPLGIVAGKKEYLDTVDGGYWNYGDSSYPGQEVTFFAGTFSKHPLTMAVCQAVLDRMSAEGPALQERVNALTKDFADNANRYFEAENVPLNVSYFSSQFKFDMQVRNGRMITPLEMDLFFYLLIEKGVYTWERRICYFSTAHTDEDVGSILNAIKSTVDELRQNGFFHRQTGRPSAGEVRTASSGMPVPSLNAKRPSVFPLSYAQRWVFGLNQIADGEKTFHLIGSWLVRGKLERQRVEYAVNQLMTRHETLRTAFTVREERIVQQVLPQLKPDITYGTISREQMNDFIRNFIQPFDLEKPPLFRVGLAELAEDESLLVIDFHHIATDGYSLNRFAEDFFRIYQGEPLPELQFNYQDYVAWESEYLESDRFREEEAYWLGRFAGELPQLDLPLDFPRPALRGFQGDMLTLEFDDATAGLLRDFARKLGCTLYMLLFASYLILLHKLTGQEDMIVGTPLAAREDEKWENNVGMFTNTLVQRNRIAASQTVRQLLDEVKLNCIQGLAHQTYPFNLLVEKVGIKGYHNRNPLFDTIFDYEITKIAYRNDTLSFQPFRQEQQTSLADLTVEAADNGSSLTLYFIYDSELFRPATIARWISYFRKIALAIREKPDATVAAIDILSGSERNQILLEFNRRKLECPADQTFHGIFAEQAQKLPERIAVEYEDENGPNVALTYGQLDADANLLGSRLRQLGVGPDAIVGVMLDRSPLIAVAVFGILKAGGAFLPLDPKQPQERLNRIVANSSMRCLVTQSRFAAPTGFAGPLVILDELLKNQTGQAPGLSNINRPSNLAYVIYTSGSTGQPKGVMVQHDNLVNAAYVWRQEYGLDREPVNLLQMANFSFDVFCGDLARVFANGGKMVICPESTRLNWKELHTLINRQKITLWESTPGLIIPFLDYLAEQRLRPEHLKLLIIGSDTCPRPDFSRIKEYLGTDTRVINSYGVTEATIDSSYFEGDLDQNAGDGAVPIGKPLPNTAFYILDRNMNPQPIGIPGELYIGGAGVSRGYFNNPELTSGRFVPNLFEASGRLYKTGDLAKWLPDGNVSFLGRLDLQIKIRGFRIEIGEIEAALKAHPAVKDAVVIVNPAKRIIAYPVTDEPERSALTPAALRQFLQPKLPDYMLPAAYVPLEKLPLSENGKINLKALPEADLESDTPYLAPRNPVEEGLAGLWRDILDQNQTGAQRNLSVYDNFFDLGGDSLKIAMLAARVQRRFQAEIPIIEIFKHPTIAAMAEYIAGHATVLQPYRPPEPIAKRNDYPLAPAQQRMFTLHRFDPSGIGFNLSFALLFQGELDRFRLEEVLRKLIRRHESLRTSFAEVNDRPVQIVHENPEFQMEYEIGPLAEDSAGASPESRIDRFLREFIRPFDLSRAPLFRAKLVKFSEAWQIENKRLVPAGTGAKTEIKPEVHLLLVDWHHIVIDGMSVKTFFEEFLQLYQGEKLPEPVFQYKDYTVWYHDYLRSNERLQRQKAYWLKRFAGPFRKFRLPYDEILAAVDAGSGRLHYFEAGSGLREQLNGFCKENHLTLFMLLLTAYYLLLYRYTGEEDMTIGSPVAGRPLADFHHVVGMFINMLALRNFPTDDRTFPQFAAEVKEATIAALENQDYQIDELVNLLNLPRAIDKSPLFDAVFVLQNTQRVSLDSLGEGLKLMLHQRAASELNLEADLNLEAEETDEGIKFNLWYKPRLFRRETIEVLAEDYLKMLREILDNPARTLGEIVQFDRQNAGSLPSVEGDFGFNVCN